MLSEIIPLSIDKIVQSRTYTVIVLKAEDKSFALYTESNVGKICQLFLADTTTQRPLTHDFLDRIFEGFEINIKQVIINDIQDNVYFARLFLEQETEGVLHIVEIDGRPSDCLILALLNNAPIYCTKEVLEKAIPMEDEL